MQRLLGPEANHSNEFLPYKLKMVINMKNHISRRFLSRQPGYNIFVLFSMNLLQDPYIRRDIEDFEREFPSVFFDEKDEIWNCIIENNIGYESLRMAILCFRNGELRILKMSSLNEIRFLLPPVMRMCDIN